MCYLLDSSELIWQPCEVTAVTAGSITVTTDTSASATITRADGSDGKVILVNASSKSHKQANPTWTDIIGSPANIAATFPQGVEGQWIPVVPATGTQTYVMNRKVISSNPQSSSAQTAAGSPPGGIGSSTS